ncbi:MAG: hypothetical protein LBD16_01765 [Oscillospiraceae bacterium]|jgi:GMP synthase (glutamine-hydrolysing)|nr:hypothetical protein [Oscillospiraceae bacterium]
MLDKILVLDMDTSGSIAIARRLRSSNIYCKILRGDASANDVMQEDPSGIIWVGDDKSLTSIDPAILKLGLPMLALSGAARALAVHLGAACESMLLTKAAETVTYDEAVLFEDVTDGERWFPSACKTHLPERLVSIARVNGSSVGFADNENKLYGLQFTIERNDPDGVIILTNFCRKICGCTAWWSAEAFVERTVTEIARIAEDRKVVCALSGGVDSSVCAMLGAKAVGERLIPVYIDSGLAKVNNDRQIEQFCKNTLKLELVRIDAKDTFLANLEGVLDKDEKFEIVSDTIREVLANSLGGETQNAFLLLGTNYSELLTDDACDSLSRNVPPFQSLIEPLIELFKDEVRDVGELLGLPHSLVHAQSFPTTGFAGRICGAADARTLELLRKADAIFSEEIERAGQERKLSQYYVSLEGCGGDTAVLRALTSGDNSQAARLPFDLIGRVAERIAEETPELKHVYYDFTAR